MKYSKTTKLTPQKQAFVNAMLTTDNATEAVRKAYPTIADKEKVLKAEGKDYPFIRWKANKLLTNDNINKQIMHQKQELTKIASKGIRRIEDIIEHSDNDKTALTASMFVVNHSVGAPTIKQELTSQSIALTIDLTSSLTEAESA